MGGTRSPAASPAPSEARRPLVVGNWKMQMPLGSAAATARAIAQALPPLPDREVAVAPPFAALLPVAQALDGSPVLLAAQDLFWEDEGAYTGEISGPMLREAGARYVIVGHSERRQYLGETDLMISLKAQAALRAALRPIVCVGERQDDRAASRHERIVGEMLLRSLDGIPEEATADLVVGYEPIWAIGTGCAASADDASEMHAALRDRLRTLFGARAAHIRILYGGSVTEQNIDDLMSRPDVDGALVGGASLHPQSFARIAAFQPHA
jgi:triosephosphate isomerase